jgi:DNA-binding GntR family transcriptional regulator
VGKPRSGHLAAHCRQQALTRRLFPVNFPTLADSLSTINVYKPEIDEDKALRTSADRVFEALQDAIVRGDIPPGSRVGETELAERFGTSRGPLREALRRLEARRLVERTPHVGIRIASLGHAALMEIYYVREALEGMAARLAALHMTSEEVAGLKMLLATHEQDEALKADMAYFQREGDLDFHYRVIQGSHNTALTQLLIGELYHRIRMYRYQISAYPKRPQKAFGEHQRIVEAIEARDGDLAEMLMRRHISSARQTIENSNKDNS